MKTFRGLVTVLALVLVPAGTAHASFFDTQRKGANCQNTRVTPEYWQAAAEAGIEFIRLVPDGWEADERDFLIGDADNFIRINRADLAVLERVLDDAHDAGVGVVLAMFSLPGARWRQLNNDEDDGRLWREVRYHAAADDFWRRLAGEVAGHPAIVAYDPLNEPHPEKEYGFAHPRVRGYEEWADSVRGTVADINVFNRGIVKAIRRGDPDTPVIIEGGFYASPAGFATLKPVDDSNVLYSFHFYESWEFVTFRVNDGRYTYPDRMPGVDADMRARWSIDTLRRHMATVRSWADDFGIPSERIIASEFGCDRRVGGAREYLADVIAVLNENEWHWAFYGFRGDGAWGGMDYELGTEKLGWRFWDAVERGEDSESLQNRHDNPLWEVIQRELR